MEEQKIENFGGEPGGQMPAPAPMPGSPVEPQQQAPIETPEVERMQMPMQPIDVSAQPSGITMQMEPAAGGGNKKVIIIGAVVVALLIVGGGAFFAWKSMNQPAPETPVTEQTAAPITVPATTAPTEAVVTPVAPELDAISTIEQDLNTFNVGGIDAEVEANLSEISKSL